MFIVMFSFIILHSTDNLHFTPSLVYPFVLFALLRYKYFLILVIGGRRGLKEERRELLYGVREGLMSPIIMVNCPPPDGLGSHVFSNYLPPLKKI